MTFYATLEKRIVAESVEEAARIAKELENSIPDSRLIGIERMEGLLSQKVDI